MNGLTRVVISRKESKVVMTSKNLNLLDIFRSSDSSVNLNTRQREENRREREILLACSLRGTKNVATREAGLFSRPTKKMDQRRDNYKKKERGTLTCAKTNVHPINRRNMADPFLLQGT